MPKYKVRRGIDAYVMQEKVFEAESADALAEEFPSGEDGADGWVDVGLNRYDDMTYFLDEIEEPETDEDFEDPVAVCILEVSHRERDAILASLRLWQRTPDDAKIPEAEIFTNSDTHGGLTLEEIDQLCENINV